MLTDSEKLTYGEEVGNLDGEIIAKEAEKKDFNDQINNQIKGASARIRDLATNLRRGSEERLVDCEWRFGIPDKNSKVLVRLDTDEVVETKALTPEDRQLWLGEDASLARSSEEGEEETSDEQEQTGEGEEPAMEEEPTPAGDNG